MFRNTFAVALRNIARKPGYAAINLIGLSVGMAAFFVITLFVRDELSYDRHHEHADRIVRLALHGHTSSGDLNTAESVPSWGPDLADRIPEIEKVVRVKPPDQMWLVARDDLKFYEKGFVFVDSSAFDVFSFNLIQGSASSALRAPFSVIVTESMARKYFGDADPMGQVLRLDNNYDFEVTGVMRDSPTQSHFKADFLASMTTLQSDIYGTDFLRDPLYINAYTYFLLTPGADLSSVEARVDQYINERAGDILRSVGANMTSELQPLTSIHLNSHLEAEILPGGSRTTVLSLSAIAVFILLIACINYMNLATARSAQRAREVGMRKALGADRQQILYQFMGESVTMACLAMVVAIVLVWAFLPLFNSLAGKDLELLSNGLGSAILVFLGAAFVCGVVAGSYPALFLSSFRPAQVLKGSPSRSGGGGGLRKGLVTLQFAASILMIAATVGVFKQLQFTRNFDLGFDREQAIVVQMTDPQIRAHYQTFRRRAENLASVASVSASNTLPGALIQGGFAAPEGAPAEQQLFYQFFGVDFGFVETLGVDLVAGRSISRDHPSDTLGAVVLNRAAARDMGWEPSDAVGRRITLGGSNLFPVVGVVENFHAESLHDPVEPAVVSWAPDQAFQYVLIRTRGGQGTKAVEDIGHIWNELYPSYIYKFSYLDDDVQALYAGDIQMGRLFGGFSLLTIVIACLGLFGLASFMTEQRTKEVGVRKVMGASVWGIVALLSMEFTRYVAVAFVIAAPLAWLGMQRWLETFTYRTEFGIFPLLVVGLGVLVLSWITVSRQTIRAAIANPVDSLRYE